MAGITFLPPLGASGNYAELLMEDLLAEYHQFDHSSEELAWRHEPGLSAVPGTRVEMIDTHPDNRPHSKIIIGRGLLGGHLVSAHPGSDWYDPTAGTRVTFNMGGPVHFDFHTPRTLDFEFRRTLSAPPSNALTDEGEVPGRNTFGILRPAPTIATSIQYIGRESRRWQDGRGILEAPDISIYTIRTDAEAVVALIRKHYYWRGAAPLIAEATGLPVRTISAVLAGDHPHPGPSNGYGSTHTNRRSSTSTRGT